MPKGKDTITLLDFKFDFNEFPLLYDAIDALPGFSKSTYNSVDTNGKPITVPQIHFESPSVAGYQATADFRVDLAAKIALDYNLDLGQFTFNAVAVSALRLQDRDPVDGTQPANDPDADLYTNLTIDTALSGITVSAKSNAATTDSTAKLNVDIVANVGAFNAGFLGDLLSLSGNYSTSIDLFKGRPGDTAASFTTDLLKGFINVPSLPSTLNAQAGGTGQALFAPSSDTEDGPIFANLTFDPIPLIPGLGPINKGAFYPIRTPLLDVGVEWKLITLDFGANLSLRQSIDVSIKSVNVAIEVDEKNFDTNDHKLVRDGSGNITGNGTALTGKLGDKFNVNFSTGDQQNTQITETYFITAHVKTNISLIPTLSLDLRLMDFALIINPILIDQLKYDFNLFNHRFDFEIGAIKLVEDGFDVTFRPVSVKTQVDTHLRVDGTEFDDRDSPTNEADVGADGVWHKALFLAGNQPDVDGLAGDDIIKGQNIDSVLAGGAGNDTINGGTQQDVIDGGDGADYIRGGFGNDTIYTGKGIVGTSERVYGDGGNDSIYVSAWQGNIDGGTGDDIIRVIVGSGGSQFISGGAGNDRLDLDYSIYQHGITLDLSGGLTGQNFTKYALKVLANSTYQSIEAVNVTGGSRFTDVLTGGVLGETLNGGGGSDTISGNDGNDVIDGGADADTLRGGAGGDQIKGGGGADKIDGGADNDTILAGDGDDTITAGTGADQVQGGNGNDTITDAGSNDGLRDFFYGQDGDDTLRAGVGDDRLVGGNGNDTLFDRGNVAKMWGDEGRDTFYVTGASTATGGNGSDTYRIGLSAVFGGIPFVRTVGAKIVDGVADQEVPGVVFSPLSNDRIIAIGVTASAVIDLPAGYKFTQFEPVVFGNSGTLIYGDGAVAATYTGIESFDLTGTDDSESWFIAAPSVGDGASGESTVLRGMGGDDFLDAGTDGVGDILDGGSGDDTIVGHAGQSLDGGTGFDVLYWQSPSRTDQVINLGNEETGLAGHGTGNTPILNFERLIMLGGVGVGLGNDSISGGIGDDIIIGGRGDDYLSGGSGNDRITSGAGGSQIYGEAGDDYILATDYVKVPESELTFKVPINRTGTMFETRHIPYDFISGGTGDDTIYASNTADQVDGGAGNDTITILNGGYRGAVVSEIRGGLGNDTIVGSDEAEVILGGPEPKDRTGLPAFLGADDDNLQGLGGDDTLSGADGNDILDGGAGNDRLKGGRGNDTLTGGEGNDLIDGSSGADKVTYATALAGVRVNLAIADAQQTVGAGTDTLISIENVTGSAFDDRLTGNDGNNTLDGLGGLDRMAGGLGNDTYVVDNSADLVFESIGAGNDKVFASASWNLAGQSIETLELTGTAGITATGNQFANSLIGNSGNNTLTGLGGNDLLDGGAGDDTLDGGGDIDTASYANAASGVTVSLALAGAQVTGGAGTDTLIGIENLTGSAFSDSLTGNGDSNILDGRGGIDSMAGGFGDDIYYVDNTSDAVAEVGRQGTDKVFASASWSISGQSIETLELIGTANIAATGDSLSNTLLGNSGKNLLTGMAGNDFLDGGAGDDTLDGGGDIDTASYARAASGVTVSLALAGAQATGGAGMDTLVSIEYLTGSAFADTLTGNAASNVLDGLGGIDTMAGGSGDDTYYVDNSGDIVIENLRSGTDTVLASTSYTLTGGFIEQLGLTGTANINATGDVGSNTLAGNTGNNLLTGGGGFDTLLGGAGADRLDGGEDDDLLVGGSGVDTLTGGNGADRFQFGPAIAADADRVTDFEAGNDKLVFAAADYGQPIGDFDIQSFTEGSSAVGSQAQFVYNSAARTLSWDADGDGAGSAVLIATFDTAVALSSYDIVMV
ncbi:MAG: hypothetical protein CFE35_17885 [Novosphingobium sp. PASSN1]|nr:MAG: hypothetical protein CFE35_17885 [Novosphingobium sp. PASSN1]